MFSRGKRPADEAEVCHLHPVAERCREPPATYRVEIHRFKSGGLQTAGMRVDLQVLFSAGGKLPLVEYLDLFTDLTLSEKLPIGSISPAVPRKIVVVA